MLSLFFILYETNIESCYKIGAEADKTTFTSFIITDILERKTKHYELSVLYLILILSYMHMIWRFLLGGRKVPFHYQKHHNFGYYI